MTTTAVKIGVDGFPIDPANIYYEQHLAIDLIIEEALIFKLHWGNENYAVEIRPYQATQSILKQDSRFQFRTILAIFDRLDWIEKKFRSKQYKEEPSLKSVDCSSQLLHIIIGRDLAYTESDLIAILKWCVVSYLQRVKCLNQHGLDLPLNKIVSRIEKYGESNSLSEEFRSLIYQSYALGVAEDRIERILIDISTEINTSKFFNLGVGDLWANKALEQIDLLTEAEKEEWSKLLVHASTATSAIPSAKWLETARSLLDKVGIANFKSYVSGWFELVERSPEAPIADRNRLILTGLIWIYSLLSDEIELETIADLTVKCYHKIPGIGPVCHKAGNAGLWLLGEIGTFQAIDCMEKLRQKVKNQAIQKQIEKYLNLAAQKTGLSREDLEELSIPTYNLDRDGTFQQTLGTATATIKILGTQKVELSWTNNGKPQKSVPADVKANFAGELKTLKRTVDDIKKTLSIQRDRLEQMYLLPHSWDLATWRDRYLNHPLLSHLTDRLIWNFATDGNTSTGTWNDGRLVDATGTEIEGLGDTDRVTLWHPIDSTISEVLAWRLWLEEHAIVQPFKQAHREVYLLTDAERVTNNYSNRFAAHIIRQHQFASLCRQRGWNSSLIGGFDSDCTPTCDLPQWDLQVEFWVDVATQDVSDSYIYLYLSTDQVRFCDRVSRVPRNLDTIPALVFSEVMRTVDLFVGVCSVGNDPTWRDGGNANFNDYWQGYSFGELGITAQLRRELLARLLPKLKIRDCCSLSERNLIVSGKFNTYHIHLGSGNIMMEPGSRYLCIVPDRLKTDRDKVLLPFEGDPLLSIILSKAFLLADDRAITDPSIISQIKRPK
jgi:Domain of unknown function (DUF4132)